MLDNPMDDLDLELFEQMVYRARWCPRGREKLIYHVGRIIGSDDLTDAEFMEAVGLKSIVNTVASRENWDARNKEIWDARCSRTDQPQP
jgi:hypothetical protein